MKLATLGSSIIATAFVALGGAALPSVAAASPDDGMVCRVGYTGALNNGHFVCSKTKQVNAGLECLNRRFPTFVVRAPGAPGDTSGGRDLCTRTGINIGTTDALTGLVLNQDYVFAEVNQTTINNAVTTNDQQEATALGLSINDVDTKATQQQLSINGGFGSNDVVRVTLTFNTFAIPALPIISLPVPSLPRLP